MAPMGRIAWNAHVKNATAGTLSLALLFAAASPAEAGTKKFDGGAGSGYAWASLGNWSPDGVPVAGDDIVMDNTLQNPIRPRNSLSASITVRSIEFVNNFALNNLWTLGNSGGGNNTLTVTPNSGLHLIKVGCTSGRVRFQQSISKTSKLSLIVGASGAIDVAAGGTLELDLAVTGAVGADITKAGAGTLLLSGANTYSGATTISAGTVRLFGGPTSVTLGNSGFETPVQAAKGFTYDPADASWTFSSAGVAANESPWYREFATEGVQAAFIQQNDGWISQGFTTASAGYYVIRWRSIGRSTTGPKGLDLKIDGNVAQSFTPQQLIFATYISPIIYITAGSHTVGFYAQSDAGNPDLSSCVDAVQIVRPLEAGGDVIPDGAGKGNVTVNGTLDLNALSETINGLSGSGTVDTEAGGTPTLTVGNNDASSTFSGLLKNTAGTLSLTKTGAGTLTLSGPNTHSGGTTVSAGTLLVSNASGSGTGSGTVTVNGGTFGGAGTIGGAVTVNAGGTLAPGTSVGALTVNGNLTLNSGSTTEMEVNRGASPNADKVQGIGILTQGGTLTVINGGADLQVNDTFTLFSATSKSGEFAAISPANPNGDADLAWDRPELMSNGILRVHRSPNASDKAITRGQDLPLKVKWSDLFASEDDDGDDVVLEQCKPSTKGATITTNATYIFYVLGSNDDDDFDYVVTDSRGGKRTRKITITVAEMTGQAQQISVVNGKPTVKFAGIPGQSYTVQRATDVNFTQNLTPVLTTSAPADGLFSVMDEPGLPSAYYRLKCNP